MVSGNLKRLPTCGRNRPGTSNGNRPSSAFVPRLLESSQPLERPRSRCSSALRRSELKMFPPVPLAYRCASCRMRCGASEPFSSCRCPVTVIFDLDETLMYNPSRHPTIVRRKAASSGFVVGADSGGGEGKRLPPPSMASSAFFARRPPSALSPPRAATPFANYVCRPHLSELLTWLSSQASAGAVESAVWTHGRRVYAAPFVQHNLRKHFGSSSRMLLRDECQHDGSELFFSTAVFAELGGSEGTKRLDLVGRSKDRLLLIENNSSSVAEEDKGNAVIVPDFLPTTRSDDTLVKLVGLFEEIVVKLSPGLLTGGDVALGEDALTSSSLQAVGKSLSGAHNAECRSVEEVLSQSQFVMRTATNLFYLR